MSEVFHRILLATDGSEGAGAAVVAAADLAARTGSELHIVYAWARVPSRFSVASSNADDGAHQRESGQATLEQVARQIISGGGTVSGLHLREGSSAAEIAAVATEVDADLLLIGSRGHGRLRRFALGSVAGEVAATSETPVLIMRGSGDIWPPTHVILADDGSSDAWSAALLGVRIAELYAIPARLLSAFPRPPIALAIDREMQDEVIRYIEAIMQTRAEQVEAATGYRPSTRAVLADPADAISASLTTGEKRGLATVGRHGRRQGRSDKPGTVASKVIQHAPGPVLVSPAQKAS